MVEISFRYCLIIVVFQGVLCVSISVDINFRFRTIFCCFLDLEGYLVLCLFLDLDEIDSRCFLYLERCLII